MDVKAFHEVLVRDLIELRTELELLKYDKAISYRDVEKVAVRINDLMIAINCFKVMGNESVTHEAN